MIDISTEIPAYLIRDAKLSDWLEQQPFNKWGRVSMRDSKGKMCAWGFIADFFGFDWDQKCDGQVFQFVCDKMGIDFSSVVDYLKYDRIHEYKGTQAAKDYVVNALRENGY